MTTSAVTSATSDPLASLRYQEATREVKKTLDQSDFLKLLTTQLANQDPMEPMKDTEFVAQMANFTSLEQTKGMSSTMAQLLASQQAMSNTTLIGKQVTLADADGNTTVKGVVSEVRTHDDKQYLVINDAEYEATNITSVAAAPVTTTNNTNS